MSRTIEVIKHHMAPAKPTAAANQKRAAVRSGTFAIGGDLPVHRLGYGAMQLTGPGVWGEPADRVQAIAVLRRAVELGINLIDTADSYGPYVSEELIREALYPYPKGLVIATKAGLARPGPGRWVPLGRPEYLRQECEMSLRRLGVERIDLFQLHRIDPKVPADDQFGVLRDLQKEGWPLRSQCYGDRSSASHRANRHCAKSIQSRVPALRRCARLLHSRKHRVYPVVSTRNGRPRETTWRIDKNSQAARRPARASSSRLVAQEIPCNAADPGNFKGKAPRREHCRSPAGSR